MIILLDIDGVMVPAKGWKSPELMRDGFPAFSDRAVRTLQQLITASGCIVLTTSHKGNYTIPEWRQLFAARGIIVDQLQKLDDNTAKLSRKDEILQWLDAHPEQEEFIIIDDDTSLHELPEYLKQRLVLTSPLIGLTEAHLALVEGIQETFCLPA